jgi:hypothetical protein
MSTRVPTGINSAVAKKRLVDEKSAEYPSSPPPEKPRRTERVYCRRGELRRVSKGDGGLILVVN